MPNHKLTLTSKNSLDRFFTPNKISDSVNKHKRKIVTNCHLEKSKKREREKKSPEADIENHFK